MKTSKAQQLALRIAKFIKHNKIDYKKISMDDIMLKFYESQKELADSIQKEFDLRGSAVFN